MAIRTQRSGWVALRLKWHRWPIATQVLVLGAATVLLVAVLAAAYVVLFIPRSALGLGGLVIMTSIVGVIADVPVLLFALAFGFGVKLTRWLSGIAVVYGGLVLVVGVIGTIQNVIYMSTQTIPPGPQTFEPDGLEAALLVFPGTIVILIAGIVGLVQTSKRSNLKRLSPAG